MRHLHDLTAPLPTTAALWYSAHQTRTGMRHLLRVPIYELDITQMRLPTHIRHATEDIQNTWRQNVAQARSNAHIPSWIVPDLADRMCRRDQSVTYWRSWTGVRAHTPRRPRGFCEVCWRMWADPRIGTLARSLDPVQRIGGLTTPPDNLAAAIATWTQEIDARRF